MYSMTDSLQSSMELLHMAGAIIESWRFRSATADADTYSGRGVNSAGMLPPSCVGIGVGSALVSYAH